MCIKINKVGKQEVGIWWVQKLFLRYGVPIWSLWPNIRFLPSIVAKKNATKNILEGRTYRRTEVKQYIPPPPPLGSGGIINHQSESSNWQTLSHNVVSSDYIGRCELNNQKITATMSRRVSEADQQANIGAGKYNYNLNFSRKSTKKCNYIFSCYNWICYYTIFL